MDGAWPWILFGFVMWLVFAGGGKGRYGCSSKRKRAEVARQDTSETVRLREALADSHAQIDALKSRLEAVETIVTDEERNLRREFRNLEQSGA